MHYSNVTQVKTAVCMPLSCVWAALTEALLLMLLLLRYMRRKSKYSRLESKSKRNEAYYSLNTLCNLSLTDACLYAAYTSIQKLKVQSAVFFTASDVFMP